MRGSLRLTGIHLLCGTAVVALAGAAQAQTNSLFGSSGAVSRSGGSFNQLGSTGTAGAGRATGGSLGGGLGATGGAQGAGIGTGPTMSATGSLGAQIGQNGMAGTAGTSQGFIGAGQPSQQTGSFGRSGFGGATSSSNMSALQGGRGGGNQFGGARGGNGQFGSQQGTASRSAQRALSLRPQQRVAFEYQAVTEETIATNLSRRLETLNPADGTTEGAPPTRVSMELGDGGLVTLRGTVESENARRLAEALARMEPGVRKVLNELEVRND